MSTKRLRWFNEYERLGYSIERARSGHFKVRDPNGVFVASVSVSPSDRNAHKAAQADLRRHERHRHGPQIPRARNKR
jgi:hypothetical protein